LFKLKTLQIFIICINNANFNKMILSFSFGNFRSFNEIQTIDFRATKLISENKDVDDKNIATVSNINILRTVGIYGANGSGKTNIIRAFSFLKQMVANSLRSERLLESLNSPFVLTSNDSNKGYFQIVIFIDNRKYRYGFTTNEDNIVVDEWLFGQAEKNETFYFKRTREKTEINREWFPEGNSLPLENLREDTLFLTFVSSYNGEISRKIRGCIADKIIIENDEYFSGSILDVTSKDDNYYTNRLLKSGNKALVLEWLKGAGLFYENIDFEEINNVSPGDSHFIIRLYKNIFDNNGKVINRFPMWLAQDESSGTQKFYSYIGQLHQLFLTGGLFIVDEIDANFHPSLLLKLINLFNNKEFNKANAQILFTTHDTNLLDPNVLRRDQIYFVEKSLQEASIIYSLADLKGIRNNADFARQYLAGIYGGLPILDNYISNKI